MIFDLQINPGVAPWPVLCDAARAAEDAGFAALWTIDHLQGSVMGAPDMPECFTLLGALAAATSTIDLGPLVVNVGNRHPGLLANAAATVQAISNGRLLLGLGAGGGPTGSAASERLALGLAAPATIAERHAVLEHTLDVLDAMWSPGRDEKFATFPLPSPRPPIVLGVNGERLARIAGRRAQGVNVRATSDKARGVITAFLDERRLSGATGECQATVWDFFDESLFAEGNPKVAEWESWGVNRVILIMYATIDVARIARAGKLLAS